MPKSLHKHFWRLSGDGSVLPKLCPQMEIKNSEIRKNKN